MDIFILIAAFGGAISASIFFYLFSKTVDSEEKFSKQVTLDDQLDKIKRLNYLTEFSKSLRAALPHLKGDDFIKASEKINKIHEEMRVILDWMEENSIEDSAPSKRRNGCVRNHLIANPVTIPFFIP